jgi:3-dehydroquinate dehydratase-2
MAKGNDMNILVLNGPNLNLLGQRETQIYGTHTLAEIESILRRSAARHVRLEFYQSNQEGVLIDRLQQAPRSYQGVVFNPGGFAHTSVALRDAIEAISIPVIEVHISNIHGREDFRARSLTAGVCAGLISGMGPLGYQAAIESVERIISSRVEARGEPRVEARRPDDRRPDERRPEERRPDDRGGESEEDRDGKRRRRGRRGGRGRRRGGEFGDEGPETEEIGGSVEKTPVDIEKKYAGLKGATVRRGLDVLAEDEAGGESSTPVGPVTFADRDPDENPGDREPMTIPPRYVEDRTDDTPHPPSDAPIRRVRVTGTRRSSAPPIAPDTSAARSADGDDAPDTDDAEDTSAGRGKRKSSAKKTTKKTVRKRSTKKAASKKSASDDE